MPCFFWTQKGESFFGKIYYQWRTKLICLELKVCLFRFYECSLFLFESVDWTGTGLSRFQQQEISFRKYARGPDILTQTYANLLIWFVKLSFCSSRLWVNLKFVTDIQIYAAVNTTVMAMAHDHESHLLKYY